MQRQKPWTVEGIVDKDKPTDLWDLKQQIKSLTTIMKSTTVGNAKMESGEGVLSLKKKEAFRGSPKENLSRITSKMEGNFKTWAETYKML